METLNIQTIFVDPIRSYHNKTNTILQPNNLFL